MPIMRHLGTALCVSASTLFSSRGPDSPVPACVLLFYDGGARTDIATWTDRPLPRETQRSVQSLIQWVGAAGGRVDVSPSGRAVLAYERVPPNRQELTVCQIRSPWQDTAAIMHCNGPVTFLNDIALLDRGLPARLIVKGEEWKGHDLQGGVIAAAAANDEWFLVLDNNERTAIVHIDSHGNRVDRPGESLGLVRAEHGAGRIVEMTSCGDGESIFWSGFDANLGAAWGAYVIDKEAREDQVLGPFPGTLYVGVTSVDGGVLVRREGPADVGGFFFVRWELGALVEKAVDVERRDGWRPVRSCGPLVACYERGSVDFAPGQVPRLTVWEFREGRLREGATLGRSSGIVGWLCTAGHHEAE